MSYHADAAGDSDAVLRYAPLAGELAAGVGAHREAAEQYDRAIRHAAGAPAARLAELWECRADACERSHWMTERAPGADQLSGALEASARAVELWRAVGDGEREVVVVARRSHMLWNAGRAEAQDTARAAAALLEALPPGPRPARAYAALARLFMLARDDAAAVSLGTTAVDYAQRYEQAGTLTEALGVVGNAHWTTDPDRAVELLTAALDAARSAGDDLGVAAILCNLGSGAAEIRRYQQADGWLGEAVAWCAERDLDSLRDLGLSWLARCHLEQGRWGEASAAAAAVLGSHPAGARPSSGAHRRAGCAGAAATRTRSHRWIRHGRRGRRPAIFDGSGLRPPHAPRVRMARGNEAKSHPGHTGPTTSPSSTDHPWATGEPGHWMRIADWR